MWTTDGLGYLKKLGMTMKFLIIFPMSLIGSFVFASDLTGKSLRVGTPSSIGSFSYCVANEAVSQVLKSSYKYSRLLYSSIDASQPEPWIPASLVFLVDKLEGSQKDIFHISLSSKDRKWGWQLIQESSGEIAPYSTLVSIKATVLKSDSSSVGEVDLSNCSEQ